MSVRVRERMTPDEFKRLVREDEASPRVLKALLAKAYDAEVSVEGDDAARQLRWVISTGAVDRSRDTVSPVGFKLENFEKNPVVLWCHNSWGLPIAKALRTWVEVENGVGKVKSVSEHPTEDVYDFGDTCYKLAKNGYINAVSVGFAPLKWTQNAERGDWAFDFLEQELLEYSLVPIPANPEALIEARSVHGIDLEPMVEWAEKVLDQAGEAGLWVPRRLVERAHQVADGRNAVTVEVRGVDTATGTALAEQLLRSIKGESQAASVSAEAGSGQAPNHPPPAPASIDERADLVVRVASGVFAKRGRVLSATNEQKLRAAVAAIDACADSIEKAAEEIAAVLALVDEEAEVEDDKSLELSDEDVSVLRRDFGLDGAPESEEPSSEHAREIGQTVVDELRRQLSLDA